MLLSSHAECYLFCGQYINVGIFEASFFGDTGGTFCIYLSHGWLGPAAALEWLWSCLCICYMRKMSTHLFPHSSRRVHAFIRELNILEKKICLKLTLKETNCGRLRGYNPAQTTVTGGRNLP